MHVYASRSMYVGIAEVHMYELLSIYVVMYLHAPFWVGGLIHVCCLVNLYSCQDRTTHHSIVPRQDHLLPYTGLMLSCRYTMHLNEKIKCLLFSPVDWSYPLALSKAIYVKIINEIYTS